LVRSISKIRKENKLVWDIQKNTGAEENAEALGDAIKEEIKRNKFFMYDLFFS